MEGKVVFIGSARVVGSCCVVWFRAVASSLGPPIMFYLFIVFPVVRQVTPRLSYYEGVVQEASYCYRQVVLFVGLRWLQEYPYVYAIGYGVGQGVSGSLGSLFVYVDIGL